MLKVLAKNLIRFRVFAMFTLFLAGVLLISGCNRKIGLKPGEQSKKDKSKCKCKKTKGGIYAAYYSHFDKFIG